MSAVNRSGVDELGPAAGATFSTRSPAVARLLRVRLPLLAVPVGLAVTYLVLLVVRYPQLIAWQNADSDVASWYVLGAAVGHAGPIQFSGQGIWPQLLLMYLTRGLSWHRVLWELIAPAGGVVTVIVIARSVASLAGRAAGLLAASLLVACSPVVLMCAISLGWHNLTPLGVALLGTHLVWLRRSPRRPAALWASVVPVSLVAGMLLACDDLLGVVGLLPYLLAAALGCLGGDGRRRLLLAVATAAVSGVVAVAILVVGDRLGIVMERQPFGLALDGAAARAHWLINGLLRIGNGRAPGPHVAAVQTPLIVACGVITVVAFGAVAVLAIRAHRARRDSDSAAATALHTSFWAIAILGAALSYVFSDQVAEPSDRYLVIALYAVGATVPLLLTRGPRVTRLVQLGAALFAAGSLVALANAEIHDRSGYPIMVQAADVAHTAQLERVVARHRLGIGYAGYWDAASLRWSSHGSLTVFPLAGNQRFATAMFFLRAAGWYRPRADTPSYLILAPGDLDFPDRRPTTLPRPTRVFHVADITIDAWPYDIAAYLRASPIPVPGLSASALRRARLADRD